MTEGPHLNLSFPAYRAEEGTNKSLLCEFDEAATPLHFTHRKPKESTADMDFGTVIHAAVLTPESFADSYHLRPETYPSKDGDSKPWHGSAQWCKDWLAKHADRPVLTRADLERIAQVRQTLTSSPKLEMFQAALAQGQKEVSFFKQDEETGLLLKARTDLIVSVRATNDETWIFDLKKTQAGCAGSKEFGEQVARLGYDVQQAHYKYVTGASRFIFIAFDDDAPYDAMVHELVPEAARAGHVKWRDMLRRYAACVKSGVWPGYKAGIQPLETPYWRMKEVEKI